MDGNPLQASLDFHDREGLDDIPDVDVVEALQAAAALEAGGDFLGVVLAALERGEGAGVDHDAVADEAYLRLGGELAFLDLAAGDGADLGDLEGLLDLGGGGDLFLLLRDRKSVV